MRLAGLGGAGGSAVDAAGVARGHGHWDFFQETKGLEHVGTV